MAVGDEATLRKICQSFLTRSADTKANLAKSCDAGDFVSLRRHAHSLKGACGYVCSEQLKASSLKLQLACEEINEGKTRSAADIHAALLVVYEELELVAAAIQAHLDTPPAKK